MLTEVFHALWPLCVFASGLMFITWWLALRVNNLGIVDVVWSLAFTPPAIYYGLTACGDPTRRGFITGMTVFWSMRLGLYLCSRVWSHHPHEDVRYSRLRAKWGHQLSLQVFIFFQIQGLLVVLLSLPLVLVCLDNKHAGIAPLEWLGMLIWLLAITGEVLADRQLQQFRSDPKNHGRVCQTGLWYYSRHPNYFFEWLVWVGFFVFALSSPWGIVSAYCPALMLFFLLRVTGIPLTEELSLQSKGDAYREYQRTTSPFLPWFKRRKPLQTESFL